MSQLEKSRISVDSYNVHVAAEVARRAPTRASPPSSVQLGEDQRSGRHHPFADRHQAPASRLPQTDEPGPSRYLFGQGLPVEFPYANGAYARVPRPAGPATPAVRRRRTERGTDAALAGSASPRTPNQRFHYLGTHPEEPAALTAFDGPTLYGLDSDHEGVPARSARRRGNRHG